MASIPRDSIKKFLKKNFEVNVTDEAAGEIVKILEHKAKEISKYAVNNAKKEKRSNVTKADVMTYVIKGYDE